MMEVSKRMWIFENWEDMDNNCSYKKYICYHFIVNYVFML
jgi:hypothetical protein